VTLQPVPKPGHTGPHVRPGAQRTSRDQRWAGLARSFVGSRARARADRAGCAPAWAMAPLRAVRARLGRRSRRSAGGRAPPLPGPRLPDLRRLAGVAAGSGAAQACRGTRRLDLGAHAGSYRAIVGVGGRRRGRVLRGLASHTAGEGLAS
jgi:hypothetical protein